MTLKCTGLTAAYCPIHGDCSCADREEAMDDFNCPLHGPASDHPRPAFSDAAGPLGVPVRVDERIPYGTAVLSDGRKAVGAIVGLGCSSPACSKGRVCAAHLGILR